MNKPTIFNYDSKAVRTVSIDGEPWFVAKDVCAILGYVNASDSLAKHCKGVAKRYPLTSYGGIQEARIINEADLFRLIIKSNLPEAVKFEKWIFEEVLPSIRKTGSYSIPQNDDQLIMIGYEAALRKIQMIQPKADYYDKVLQTEDLICTRKIASDLGITAVKLNLILKREDVQYKLGDQWILKAKYSGKDYTKSKTHIYTDKNGKEHSTITTYWTQKGREFVISFMKRLNGTAA